MFQRSNLKSTLITLGVSIVLAILLSLFASPAISPIYGIYEGSSFTYDPALFKYEALAILEGQKPYIDFYDHKGIWHLGIYILAVLINKQYGLLILEMISGSIAIFFYLETIKVLTSSLVQRHIAVFYFIIIRFIVGTGMTIGILLLPFVAIYFYFYLRAVKEQNDNLFIWGSVFLGLSVSFALNSRPLDIVYAWGGAFFLIAYSIKEKKYPVLIKNAVAAFVAFIIPVIVITIISLENGYFNEMIQSVLLDNFRYIGRGNGVPIDQIMFRLLSALVAGMYIFFYFYRKKSNGTILNLFIFVAGFSAFVPLVFMIRFFSHFVASTPILGASIVYFIESAPKENKTIKKIFVSLTGALAAILSLTPMVYYTFGLSDFQYSKNERDINALLTSIPEEDRQNRNIYAVDCSCQVYHLLGVVGDAKYYCNQTWWSYDDPAIMGEAIEYVRESKPKYVILWKQTLDEKWEDALESYTMIDDSAERFFIYKINI